jgi:hypothetical protein
MTEVEVYDDLRAKGGEQEPVCETEHIEGDEEREQ